MTSGLGSISMTGLLGGNAGKIDTDALVKALMAAKSVPKNHLETQLEHQQQITANYRGLNSQLQALTTAAQAVTDVDFGTATAASSSLSSVVASSTAGAATGMSTFHVEQLAATQVSTVAADTGGNVVAGATPSSTINITIGGTSHDIGDLGSGSTADVAKAINKADIGVSAALIETDGGQVLQLAAKSTGEDNAFVATGFGSGSTQAQAIVDAQNAKVTVGAVGSGGYAISSQTNTFTDAMPGVTFTAGSEAEGKDVTISVSEDITKIGNMVKAMVDAANTAKGSISQVTGKGGILQGYSDVRTIGTDLGSAISMGTADGQSLIDYGVDMDKNGVITFDAAKFAAAYAGDAKGTVDAIAGSLGTSFLNVAQTASAPITGTLAQSIKSGQDRAVGIGKEIDSWNDRLDTVENQLRTKYIAMQSAMARLQSQSDWLTSMFDGMNGSKD